MNGVLVVDKPAGPTSHDVVARVRRASGIWRIGHTGTLDPPATGVLPLVIGSATRLARFLAGREKVYDAHIRLGSETDTYDATGSPRPRPIASSDRPRVVDLSADDLRRELAAFTGSFAQQPPRFSAKRIGGIRAHALARRDQAAELRAVEVTVYRIELLSFEHDVIRLRIECSAGFYVRSLAHDLGRRLGCGAHLATLRRTRSGDFDLDRAVSLDAVERQDPGWLEGFIPLESLLPAVPAAVLAPHDVRRAAHGNEIAVADLVFPFSDGPPTAGPVRLLDEQGHLLGIAETGATPALLHPVVVLV